MRERREQMEAMLVTGQARLERARSSMVDTMVGVVRRECPVAVGIPAGSLAFRLFALPIPLCYVLVAGLGFAAEASASEAQPPGGKPARRPGDLPRWPPPAAARNGAAGWPCSPAVATLIAAAGVLEVLRWVHLLAWRMRPTWQRIAPWGVLGLVAGIAVEFAAWPGPSRPRSDAQGLASELTVILVTAGVQVVVLAALWQLLSLAMPRPGACPGPPWYRGRACSRSGSWPST